MSGNMNRIPQSQLDEWKRDAVKAGSLPWRRGTGNEYKSVFRPDGGLVCERSGAFDGNHIANACPANFLALIAEVEDLTKTLAGFGEEG